MNKFELLIVIVIESRVTNTGRKKGIVGTN